MRVLGLASYPIEAAATRYRLAQFVEPLAARGIDLTIEPFLNSRLFGSLYKRDEIARNALGLAWSAARRLGTIARARRFDVLLVQREAMILGPAIVERLSMLAGGCPMVLDLDDATYVAYTSPTHGKIATWLKWFSKTDDLISRSSTVTCGNRSIAEYVRSKGRNAEIIPTVVDTDVFCPLADDAPDHVPVLGWIGTHSTFPYLQTIFPVLEELARTRRFKVKVVGAGRDHLDIPGVEVENLTWNLEREVLDFQTLDIGLYPVVPGEWAAGKSGFKAIQYMAVGIPYIATPTAACAEIGVPGQTHIEASAPEEWYSAIDTLLGDVSLRKRMGEAGRKHAIEYYNLPLQADRLAKALRETLSANGGVRSRGE